MSKPGRTLMIQGTASNVGKSIMTAAFCRLLRQAGFRTAPFKAQNMSNNSFVTPDGGEIGRAQAVQAEACGLEPSVLMNPILLKPDSDMKAQVVVKGRPVTKIRSIGHPDYQKRFQPVVREALDELRQKYDVVVIEGAGSPAEMNLKERDIVNMSIARYAKSPVILVGDIDWGGIFAQLVGTYDLLDAQEKRLVKAFVINKFRGDKKILDPGVDWIEKRTGEKVLGVIPYLSDLEMAEEDSIASGSNSVLAGLKANTCLDAVSGKARDRREIRAANQELLIDIAWLPHISNFTDFESLEREPGVVLRYLHEPDRHTLPDLVMIPGTKSTLADLGFLERTGMAASIRRSAQAGVPVLGICGGYQMLGRKIRDRRKVESSRRARKGLALLPAETDYARTKITSRVEARCLRTRSQLRGYEIHMGRTRALGRVRPFARIEQRDGQCVRGETDGMVLETRTAFGLRSWVAGTYIHGLFDAPGFRQLFLDELRRAAGLRKSAKTHTRRPVDVYDRLARHVECHIDMPFLKSLVEG